MIKFKPLLLSLFSFGTLAVAGQAHSQTVVNGTFDDPSFGGGQNGHLGDLAYFSSDYIWTPPTSGANTDANQYTVANANRPWNDHGSNVYGDHTTGTGKYLIVNGSTVANTLVWQQSISGFNVGSQYTFSGYISDWTGNGNPGGVLNLKTDGTIQGADITTPAIANTWVQFDRGFTATSTSLTLSLFSTSTAFLGNDFAFDDFSLTSVVPEPSSFVAIGAFIFLFGQRRIYRKRT
jgi:hypothetical protein